MNRREQLMRLVVLRILIQSDDLGFTMREDDLHNAAITMIRPAPSTSETRATLNAMDAEHHVVGVLEDGIMRYAPTAGGKAWKLKQEVA
jgi:hypothetical protein